MFGNAPSNRLRRSLDGRGSAHGHESARGQILPLFAISLVALLALTGLGLDSARVMLERRQAQGAADLAAISGARSLPDDQPAALAAALEVAAANGYPSSQVTVTFPEASKISVQVDNNIPMLFTAVVGVTDTDVGAHAAAVHTEEVVGGAGGPLAGPAILAYDNVCDQNDTLKWDAHNTTINGDVVTNSGGDINGSNNVMNGDETWYTTGACASSLFIDPSNNPDPNFQAVTDLVGYPLDPLWAPFADPIGSGLCDHLQDVDQVPVDGSSVPPNQIADGIYCRVENLTDTVIAPTKKLTIKTEGSWCNNCTFIADLIQSSAANTVLDPELAVTDTGSWCRMSAGNTCSGYPIITYSPGTLKNGINFSGSNQQWDGVMFSPYGTTHYTGHDAAVYDGAIWSRIVQIIGSGFTLNGPSEWGIGGGGGPAQPEVLALVE